MITLKHQIEFETFFLLILAFLVGLFLVFRSPVSFLKLSIITDLPVAIVEPTPTEIPLPRLGMTSQISQDGTKKVIMRTAQNIDGTKTYIFFTADGSGSNEQFFFKQTFDGTRNMVIPFNAWSPDNKYFFIQQNLPEGKKVLVFRVSNTPFPDGKMYLDITNIFKQKNTGNVFNEATGWASESLIIVNTTTPNGAKGPSFWFEVPSKAVIQLATEF